MIVRKKASQLVNINEITPIKSELKIISTERKLVYTEIHALVHIQRLVGVFHSLQMESLRLWTILYSELLTKACKCYIIRCFLCLILFLFYFTRIEWLLHFGVLYLFLKPWLMHTFRKTLCSTFSLWIIDYLLVYHIYLLNVSGSLRLRCLSPQLKKHHEA